MGGLQMDWLRSEDLKEEKGITTSFFIITAKQKFSLRCSAPDAVPFDTVIGPLVA